MMTDKSDREPEASWSTASSTTSPSPRLASATRGSCSRPRASPCSPCSSTRRSASSRSRPSTPRSRRPAPSTVSWVLNAYTLVFAALLIPAGRLADRVGRRKMFLIGVVVFTTGSMLCGLAPTVGFLIGAEMLEAVGAAILVPASLALVLQTFPRHKVPVAVAIWGAIGAAAGAARPDARAPCVVTNLSWRWAFFINLPVGVVSLLPRPGRAARGSRGPSRPPARPARRRPARRRRRPRSPTPSCRPGRGAGAAPGSSSPPLAGVAAARAVRRSAAAGWRTRVIHLELFRTNNFRWANAAMLVYAVGLQRDVPRQRVVPDPGLGLLDPDRRPRHLDRPGDRRRDGTAVREAWPAGSASASSWCPGGLVWAAGGALLLLRATTTPDYVGVYLPAGICHRPRRGARASPSSRRSPSRASRPTSSAPARRSRRRCATSARRSASPSSWPSPPRPPAATSSTSFHHVWWLLVACGVVVSLVSTRLTRGPARAGAPATAAIPVLAAD